MPVSAHDIAAALRERLPGVPVKKLHKLLYYCQGHHLAAFGEPLFAESVSAWDMGPVVGQLWKREQKAGPVASTPGLDEAALNTIGYVVSRYGRLTGRDLEILSHGEGPWQRADAKRRPGGSARIERAWLRAWFAAAADDEGPAPHPDEVARFLGDSARPARRAADELAALRARLTA